jgi:hypothetical protein
MRAVMCIPVYEPQVLTGVGKFAENAGLDLCFPAAGKLMFALDEHRVCLAIAETDDG